MAKEGRGACVHSILLRRRHTIPCPPLHRFICVNNNAGVGATEMKGVVLPRGPRPVGDRDTANSRSAVLGATGHGARPSPGRAGNGGLSFIAKTWKRKEKRGNLKGDGRGAFMKVRHPRRLPPHALARSAFLSSFCGSSATLCSMTARSSRSSGPGQL